MFDKQSYTNIDWSFLRSDISVFWWVLEWGFSISDDFHEMGHWKMRIMMIWLINFRIVSHQFHEQINDYQQWDHRQGSVLCRLFHIPNLHHLGLSTTQAKTQE